MKGWKTEKNRKANFDLVKYIKEYLAKHSDKDVRIYVGTDSQNLKRRKATGYVTCVVFHTGSRDGDEFTGQGAHVIYREIKLRRVKDNFSRLWNEVDYTLEVVEFLRNAGILVYCVDLDFNQEDVPSESGFKSSRLISAGEGLFRGLGYNVSSKPDELFATPAADTLIHKLNWKKIQYS